MARTLEKGLWTGLLAASVAVAAITGGAQAQAKQSEKAKAPELKLRVGDVAPDFKLQYFDGHDLKDVHLSDYKGKKNVALAFYVFAFTGG